jgi:lysozyme family protein
MGKFSDALPIVQKSEGGYSNHKSDRGGKTNYGVTNVTFHEAQRQRIISKNIVSVKNITKKDAEKIFKQMYWDKIHGDDLPRDLSIAMFDMAINSGPKTAVTTLQKILKVTPDGVVGSETLLAIDNYKGNLLDDYIKAREAKYGRIVANDPSQKVFIKGWLNRLKYLRKFIDSLPSREGKASLPPNAPRDPYESIRSRWYNNYPQQEINERWMSYFYPPMRR